MKTTGIWSKFEELENNPEKPFIKDIEEDLKKINNSFSKKEAREIKVKMMETILKDI